MENKLQPIFVEMTPLENTSWKFSVSFKGHLTSFVKSLFLVAL